MQVYKYLDIGTAKPSKQEQDRLHYHLLDIVHPDKQFTVADFISYCDKLIPNIISRHRIPVITGGSAFYLQNFLFGLPETPAGNPSVRKDLDLEEQDKGLKSLYSHLQDIDPESASHIEPNDSFRIKRAIEVYRITGKPRSAFKRKNTIRTGYDPLVLGLYREREQLYERINARVITMIESGLEAEIRSLLKMGYKKSDPGLRAIGYREYVSIPQSQWPEKRDSITKEIQKNTRRYAKRQMTFFKKIDGVSWFQGEEETALSAVDKYRKSFNM